MSVGLQLLTQSSSTPKFAIQMLHVRRGIHDGIFVPPRDYVSPFSPPECKSSFYFLGVFLGERGLNGPDMVYIIICLIWDRNPLWVPECFFWGLGAQCGTNVGRLSPHSGACGYVFLCSRSHLESLGCGRYETTRAIKRRALFSRRFCNQGADGMKL